MTVEEKLKWQIEICGIDKYHAKGYKGRGITVLCHEDNEHGRQAMSILQMVAPEVSIVYSSVNRKEKDGKLVEFVWTINGKTYSFDEVMKVFKPDIISCSLRSPTSTIERDAIVKPYIDDGELIIVTSAGNEGASGGAQPMYDCGLVIGACQFFNGNKNDIRITSYSGRTSGKLDVDYVGFMGDWNGTSAATPFVAGQIALFMCRYGKVAQLTFQKLIKQYCKDLGDDNKDWIYGDGLIVLPEDISKEEVDMFKDVEDKRWSKKYIDKLCEEGIMNGVSRDMFAPEKPMTREEVAAVICRALFGME